MIDDAAIWVPPTDVYEIGDNYVLNAELPGVELSDIKVEFSGSDLTIRGERKWDAVCAKESYYLLEGRRGRFHRMFSLPETVDSSRIQLELKSGVLNVVLPKAGKDQFLHGSR